MKLRAIRDGAKEVAKEFSQDRVLRLAAATAYYAAFSIGPLLVLVVALAGLIFGEQSVRHEVQRQVQQFVGPQSAKMIASMMEARQKGGSLLAAVIGGAALVFGASGVFGQLQDSLNTIWGVAARPGKSLGPFLRDRFFSMAMVLGIGFLLLVSMVLSTLVNAFARFVGNLASVASWLFPLFNEVTSFIVVSLLFALIFKVLPDVRIRWRAVWLGAVGTAVLFTAGKFLLGLYLAHETVTSAYGAGSAFIVILLYVYYSSLVLFVGAEVTQVYARHSGDYILPNKYAVQITDAQRAEQGIPRQRQVEEAARGRPAPSPRAFQSEQPEHIQPSPQ